MGNRPPQRQCPSMQVGATGNPLDLSTAQAPVVVGKQAPPTHEVRIGKDGLGFPVTDGKRDGSATRYSEQELSALLSKYKERWGSCDFPMPRDSTYSLSYAPSMWQFWASDPTKKKFKRKPFVLNAQAQAQLALDEFLKRKELAWPDVKPGHFNVTPYMSESGALADALARAHKDYSLLNSRPKSGPVVVLTRCV